MTIDFGPYFSTPGIGVFRGCSCLRQSQAVAGSRKEAGKFLLALFPLLLDYLPGGMRKQPQWTLIGRSLDAHWTLQWTLQWTLRKWYQGHDFLCLRIKSFFLLEKCLLTPHIQNATPGSVFAVSTVVSTVASNERPVSAQ